MSFITASELSPDQYDVIQYDMLHPDEHSFALQMHSAAVDEVEAVLCTANSAVPVADAVRGFYEELGQPTPLLGYIRADSKISRQERGSLDRRERFEEEKARLKPFLDGRQSVCVIDQCVYSGRTLLFAEMALSGIVANRHLIKGRWYHDWEYGSSLETSLREMTTSHADFMRSVGRAAAQLVG